MKLFDKGGAELVDLIVGDDSYRNRRIMGEDSITLKVQLFEHVEIPVGAYCLHQGETYTLLRPQNIRKNHTRSLEYTLILEAYVAKLGLYKFRDTTTGKLKFSLTGKPSDFMAMLLDNLNQRESGWVLGSCIDASEKTISFNHNYCNEALKFIADAFETEFEITGKTLSLHKVEYGKESPLALSYGKGNGFRTGVRRENFENSHAIDILFVQGGTRNIDASKYGSTELLLPKSQTLTYEGRTYQTDESGLFVSRADKAISFNVEDSLDCAHIYPSRVGKVSSVVVVNASKNFYDFIDATIPEELNFRDHLIAGEKMTVVFQSGMLAGKEFDCDYSHQDRKFQIVPQEIDGQIMPNEIFKPVIDDSYAIFGISLPEAYICNNSDKSGSSWDMFREAVRYLYENEDPRFSFTGELDPIWAKRQWLEIGSKIRLGGYVAFTDEQFQAEPVLIRIIGIKDYINSPYSPEIELSNVTIGGGFSNTIKKLETTQVVVEQKHQESIRFAKRGFREAQETTELLKDAFSNFNGSISPVTISTMQLLVGDESLQFRFVDSVDTSIEVYHLIFFDAGTKILHSEAGVIQHMTIGVDQISTSHNRKVWFMEAYQSPYLDKPDTAYYLYAKVERDGDTGVFLLSEQPIKMEEFTGYYHLLVAIVNSEYQGDRSIAILYGFSEILPGRITTKRIVSSDGKTYFDLQNNQIGGNIKFISTDGDYTDINDKITDVEENVTYKVEIFSTNGNTFRNDLIDTTLIAMVYRGKEEITSTLPHTAFRWVRQSDNPDSDTTWNQRYSTFHSHVLVINSDDVDGRAVFNCQVSI
jgi:hypothetical protein